MFLKRLCSIINLTKAYIRSLCGIIIFSFPVAFLYVTQTRTTNLSSHYKENSPKLSISDDRIENVDTFQHVKYKKPLEMVTEIQKQIRLAPAELTFASQCGELRGTGRHANCDQHLLSLSLESQDSSAQLRSKAPCDRTPPGTSWTFLFGLFPSPVLTQGI